MSLEDQKAAFDLLGLPMTANEDAIRAAWRKLARTYHPDLAREDRDAANRRLAEINAAFDLLSAGYVEERRKAAEAAEARHRARLRAQAEARRRAEAERATKARQAEAEAEARADDAAALDPATQSGIAPIALPVFRTDRSMNLRARRAFDAALRGVQTHSPPCRRTTYA